MPAAHNSPGFVSFSDYLDANAGSLGAERAQLLNAADAAGTTAQSDLAAWTQQARDAGQTAGAAAPAQPQSLGRDAVTGKPLEPPGPNDAPPEFTMDVTTLPGADQFYTDNRAAQDALGVLRDNGLGGGKTAFDAGLIGGDSDYRQRAGDLQKKYGGLSEYLDQLNGAVQEGYKTGADSRKPNVSYYDVDPGGQNLPGVTNNVPPGQAGPGPGIDKPGPTPWGKPNEEELP